MNTRLIIFINLMVILFAISDETIENAKEYFQGLGKNSDDVITREQAKEFLIKLAECNLKYFLVVWKDILMSAPSETDIQYFREEAEKIIGVFVEKLPAAMTFKEMLDFIKELDLSSEFLKVAKEQQSSTDPKLDL